MYAFGSTASVPRSFSFRFFVWRRRLHRFVLPRRTYPVQRDSRLGTFGSIGLLLQVLDFEHAACVVPVRACVSTSRQSSVLPSLQTFFHRPVRSDPSTFATRLHTPRPFPVASSASFVGPTVAADLSIPLVVRPRVRPPPLFRVVSSDRPPTWCFDLADLVRSGGVAVSASERHTLRHGCVSHARRTLNPPTRLPLSHPLAHPFSLCSSEDLYVSPCVLGRISGTLPVFLARSVGSSPTEGREAAARTKGGDANQEETGRISDDMR